LDQAIEEQQDEQGLQELSYLSLESLKQKVPLFLYCYLDFWSKEQLDILALHRDTDHKIELTDNKNLGFSYLNKHSLEELTAIREYLTDNLSKSFIVNSKAPFASPVLFVRKADRLLRFCINYRKLNAITKKNRYPLLLINETLARLAKAKIFTKLDIR
jgi:hypothetical protein